MIDEKMDYIHNTQTSEKAAIMKKKKQQQQSVGEDTNITNKNGRYKKHGRLRKRQIK